MPERYSPFENKQTILDHVGLDVTNRIIELVKEQNEYDTTGSEKDEFTFLFYSAQIIHLQNIAHLVLESARTGSSIPLEIDDLSLGEVTEEGQSTPSQLLPLFDGAQKGAAKEAVEAGKKAAIEIFMELIIPIRLIDPALRKLHFRRWQGESILRNKDAYSTSDGTRILLRDTRIPDVVMAYYKNPEDESPRRLLLFPLGEEPTPPSLPQ